MIQIDERASHTFSNGLAKNHHLEKDSTIILLLVGAFVKSTVVSI